MTKSPFSYFKNSLEIIQLGVIMYVRFPLLSPRNVEDLLHQRGIDICHESVRHGVNGITCGAPSITKAESWNPMSPRSGIRLLC